MFLKKIILLLLNLQIAFLLFAQKPFQFYHVYSGTKQQINANFEEVKDNNLSIPSVTCLYQTKDGIVWIGTEQNGLLAYSGAGFKHYLYEPNNPQSLPSNFIVSIWEEAPGILWITTSNGLAKLNRYTGKIYKFSSNARLVCKGHDGILYTTANDLCTIDTASKKINHLFGQEVFLDNGSRYRDEFMITIGQISFDKSGCLWATGTTKTLSGLFHFEAKTHHWIFHSPPKHYQSPYTKSSDPTSLLIGKLYIDNEDRIWLGGWNVGLLCYQPKTNLWQQFYLDDELHSSQQNVIEAITPLNEDTLLLTCVHSVVVFNKKNFSVSRYSYKKETDDNLPIKFYPLTLADNNGNVWFAGDGVYKVNKLNNRFSVVNHIIAKKPSISSFYGLEQKHFLVASFNFNNEKSDAVIQEIENGKIKSKDVHVPNLVQQIIPAGNNKYYIATNKDLYSYNGFNNSVGKINLKITEPQTLDKEPQDFFNNVLWNDSTLFSCRRTTVSAGLMKINLKRNTVQLFKTSSKNLSPYVPQDNSISRIVLDSYNRIWCSSNLGFDIFYPGKEIFEHYSHIDNDTTSLYNSHTPRLLETSKHRFFICTESGLCEADAQPGPKIKFKLLLPIAGDWLLEDSARNLWMGIANGVIKYNPVTKSYSKYTKEDGYKGERYNKPFVMPDGNFLMHDGAIINPYLLAENTVKPMPRLVDFMLAGQPLQLDTAIEFKKNIFLQHNENFFSIVFSCTNLINEKANQYRYLLQGIDKQWIYSGTRNTAYYTALSPGTYYFFVQAANNDGVWGNKKLLLNISILPAWYQTWWAKLLLAFIIISIICVIYKQRVNAIRSQGIAAQKEAELRQVKAEFDKQIAETEMAALRAQMNPHFIFNVLNSINRFILKNDSDAASEYLSQFARLIRMILENSRSPKVSLQNDLEALRIYIEMEKLRFAGKFSYKILIDENIDQQFTEVPPLLLQPFVENAIWHGLMQKEMQGELIIRITQLKENLIKVIIEDDGIGREKSMELKSKTAVTHKSFGLQISKDRIQIVNKIYGLNTKVEVEDIVDENKNAAGTRISLLIAV